MKLSRNGFTLFEIVVVVIILLVLGQIVGYGCHMVSRTAQVVTKEIDPGYLLKKYEWFKNASAALDQKRATMLVYGIRLKKMEEDYKGEKRPAWARDDREQYSIWQSEMAGIKASYNDLASEYNAQMSKINWRFTNVGSLPAGADTTLPREYKPYEIE